ncbi:MAG: sugar transferase [Hyphomicrobium sp.]
MIKRIFDLALALAGIAVCAPVLLILVILIRRGSTGPAIFAQTRVGYREKPFVCYKLRTMYRDTGDKPTHEVGASNVTPLGAFLRRAKLDELPQLINVIKGELSLVGPRPCLTNQTELIEARRREGVFEAVPGITGLAQIKGVDMSNPAKLAMVDADYVKSRSFAGDLRILLATVTGSGVGVDRVTVKQGTQDTKMNP